MTRAHIAQGNSFEGPAGSARRAVVMLISVAVALIIALGGTLHASSMAYAEIYPVDDSAKAEQVVDGIEDSQAPAAAAATDSDQAAAESEAIADDEVPMSSGLGGGEPISAGMDFSGIIIAGIVAVVAFFAVSMFRVNRNISQMRNSFR